MTPVHALDEYFRTQHFRICERFGCDAPADYLLTRCGRYGRTLQTFVCGPCLGTALARRR